MGVSNNPSDQNLLQPSKFTLSFTRLPFIQFFCSSVNLPGLSTNPTKQPTPFIDGPVPGDKLTYDPLTITFLLDEPLWAWSSINDWIKGYAFPENFDQYKQLSLQQRLQTNNSKPQYSDAILMIMSNKNNPILEVHFKDLFPTSLSGVEFDNKLSAENIMSARASFVFTNYSIKRL